MVKMLEGSVFYTETSYRYSHTSGLRMSENEGNIIQGSWDQILPAVPLSDAVHSVGSGAD